jgi:hypothetical protein
LFETFGCLAATSGFTSSSLIMDSSFTGEDIKGHCLKTLAELGAPPELSNFFADVLHCECEMTRTVYWLYNDLTSRTTGTTNEHLPAAELFSALQNMTKSFRGWKAKIDELSKQGERIPSFQVTPSSPILHAVCSFETDQVNLHEGDEMTITDASHPDWLRVRNSSGEEGYVPALSCVIPTPDNSALTAVERLQVLLLTSWAECLRKVRSILMTTLTGSARQLASRWNAWLNGRRYNGQIGQGLQKLIDFTNSLQTIGSKELTRLDRHLRLIESEMLGLTVSTNGISLLKKTVADLDKSVLCFQTFYVQWRHFRRDLQKAPRPIRIVEEWEKLRRASQCSNFKYYELKMTLDNAETVEEITHIEPSDGCPSTAAQRSKLESVTAEKVPVVSEEERKRFVVKEVVDPRTGNRLTLRQAVAEGIVDYHQGLYINPDTGQGVPISEAMNSGSIVIEYSYVRRSPPVTDIVVLITVQRRIIDHAYTIVGAIDAMTAERVDAAEALRRGIIELNEQAGEYVNTYTGARLPLDEAIELGWVDAEFDDDSGRRSPRYSSSTHQVLGIVDRRSGCLLSFADSIRRGLLDARTGDYINNKTGRRVHLAEAIRQGLIKTKIVECAPQQDVAAWMVESSRPALPPGITTSAALVVEPWRESAVVQ